MKRKLSVILSLCAVLILSSATVYANENSEEKFADVNNVAETSIEQKVNDYIAEHSYIDEHGGLVSTTEISTLATNRVLWNQKYVNQSSVKKDIYAKNYGLNAKPGSVSVSIKNTGRKTISVNIYQSWWNSRPLAYGEIAPGSSKTFVIGPQYGGYECIANNCFAYQKFTISTHANSGTISFDGYARISY